MTGIAQIQWRIVLDVDLRKRRIAITEPALCQLDVAWPLQDDNVQWKFANLRGGNVDNRFGPYPALGPSETVAGIIVDLRREVRVRTLNERCHPRSVHMPHEDVQDRLPTTILDRVTYTVEDGHRRAT